MLQLEDRRCSGDGIREDWREGCILGHLGLSYSSNRGLILRPPFSILFVPSTGRAETRSSVGDHPKAGSFVGPQRLESVVLHPPKPSLYRVSEHHSRFWAMKCSLRLWNERPRWSVARPGRFNRAADAGSRCGRSKPGRLATADYMVFRSNQFVNDNAQGVKST